MKQPRNQYRGIILIAVVLSMATSLQDFSTNIATLRPGVECATEFFLQQPTGRVVATVTANTSTKYVGVFVSYGIGGILVFWYHLLVAVVMEDVYHL